MRIIAYINRDSGPCFHRIYMPLFLMREPDVFITNNLLEEHFEKGCDIFMYNRMIPEVAVPTIERLRLKYGFKVCVDIDDFWELDEHHILYEAYRSEGIAERQIDHIKRADFVTTTHERLYAEIKYYNQNVYILPNAIPNKGQFMQEREPYHLTRLFWQGSITHEADIALLQRPIELLAPISAKIKMIMGGYSDDPTWNKMAMDYTAKGKTQYDLLPPLPVDRYYRNYAHADICLVPLVNSNFNRHKSNLKVLEAANLGLPVIASRVHPYLDMPIVYAQGAGDWVKQIGKLVASRKRQKDAGAELAEWCQVHYNFAKINKEREQIFKHQISILTVK